MIDLIYQSYIWVFLVALDLYNEKIMQYFTLEMCMYVNMIYIQYIISTVKKMSRRERNNTVLRNLPNPFFDTKTYQKNTMSFPLRNTKKGNAPRRDFLDHQMKIVVFSQLNSLNSMNVHIIYDMLVFFLLCTFCSYLKQQDL